MPVRALLALLMLLATASAAADPILVKRADGADVQLEVYAPEAGDCAPLALISPGAGSTEKGMRYLAKALRKSGWLSAVMGHKESGPEALHDDITAAGLRGGLLKLTSTPSAYRARLMDIAATLKWADSACPTRFKVLIGHSMGAATVMIEAGARNKLGVSGEDRFDAYVALSPQGPGAIFPAQAWASIHKPMLILTGTGDKALEGDWRTRTLPFESLPPGCKWLGIIDGASHMNFAGSGFSWHVEKTVLRLIDAFLAGARAGQCVPPSTEKDVTLRTK
jgi:predicted dienelactone hydrolase